MTAYAHLLALCGMDNVGAARLLRIRSDTSRKWSTGARHAPEEVIELLKRYANAAHEIFG